MRPVTRTQEGWASSGAANSRPEMYDLTSSIKFVTVLKRKIKMRRI